MSTATKERTVAVVPPFGVEIDHPRNSDVLLQGIKTHRRLRSALGLPRPIPDRKTGEPRMPIDQTREWGQFPNVPGMQIHVNPAKLTYTIVDPLRGDEDLCGRIRKYLNANSAFHVDTKIDGVPPHKGEVDQHRMKTLCRELLRLLDSGVAKVVKGPRPSMEDVDSLPGKYLLNPGARIRNSQPTFEEDWDDWYTNMTTVGN